MSELLEILLKRRSVRTYTGEAVPSEKLDEIIKAGLLAESGRRRCPWELIVVKDKEMLKKLSECRDGSAKMLAGADAAIVVIADEEKTDVWVEDSSIVMANMHLMADHLGVGSCWIQGRLRKTPTGETTEDYLRGLLGYPDNFRLEAILSLGMYDVHPEAYTLADVKLEKVHYEKY